MTAHRDRTYGGRTLADRQADRRRRFLEAGLAEFSTIGYAASSVTSLCKAAGLSRRQFYDLFDSRETLLTKLYDEIQSTARLAIEQVLSTNSSRDIRVLASAAMRAYVESVGTDPRHAEVSFVQVVGVSRELELHRLDGRDEWVEFFVAAMSEFAGATPSPRLGHLATAFVGALTSVIHDWSLDPHPGELDEVVDVLTDILVAFAEL
ncbi:TetR/AcrR family transcriptional regulator [Gordonia sp. L191]|uniref:TetR/AcrR family transcriptional regulator n=1 Tax=Gordonia sp. L191 TaxID=2982699 RepID=UPI0024BF5F84|nr:TetR/AcrR family transcriptional regulator [Gordonia sp. L191]WHU46634.1 TetR/AcrR family transcriptional regulator [Gordonia sp. L191]